MTFLLSFRLLRWYNTYFSTVLAEWSRIRAGIRINSRLGINHDRCVSQMPHKLFHLLITCLTCTDTRHGCSRQRRTSETPKSRGGCWCPTPPCWRWVRGNGVSEAIGLRNGNFSEGATKMRSQDPSFQAGKIKAGSWTDYHITKRLGTITRTTTIAW